MVDTSSMNMKSTLIVLIYRPSQLVQELVNQQYEGEVEELEAGDVYCLYLDPILCISSLMGMLETTSKLGRKQLIYSVCWFLLETDGHFMIYAIFFSDPRMFGGV